MKKKSGTGGAPISGGSLEPAAVAAGAGEAARQFLLVTSLSSTRLGQSLCQ